MAAGDGPVLAMSREDAERLLADSTSKPHEGRVYDFYLGGNSNYATDRAFAAKTIAKVPDIPWGARQNRKFLARAVQHMIGQGIRQFIDMGSGLPTEGNVHQIVRQYTQDECHVVYVDHDPVASAHAYLLLEDTERLEHNRPINGDLLDYDRLWDAIEDTELIDPQQPVGLLLLAVLHFTPDEVNPQRAVAFYRDRLASGSHLAISHASTDGMSQEAREALMAAVKDYDRATSSANTRTRAEMLEFFGDWPLVEPPGLVWTPEWTTDKVEQESIVGDMDPTRSQLIAALARKP
jgi:O-methyltransferase involved in polyketide biosynthesis